MHFTLDVGHIVNSFGKCVFFFATHSLKIDCFARSFCADFYVKVTSCQKPDVAFLIEVASEILINAFSLFGCKHLYFSLLVVT